MRRLSRPHSRNEKKTSKQRPLQKPTTTTTTITKQTHTHTTSKIDLSPGAEGGCVGGGTRDPESSDKQEVRERGVGDSFGFLGRGFSKEQVLFWKPLSSAPDRLAGLRLPREQGTKKVKFFGEATIF